MTRSATLRSLAKINLDLRVLHKRPDGFHELRSVFQTISLADRIGIEYTPGRKTLIELDDPLAIPDNLVVRAARAVMEATRSTGRVQMTLKKTIPMGGGLGGGSSNAASILLALPVLLGKQVENIHQIAVGLGSDVPFFLLGGTAAGLGRGEELYGLPDIAPEPVLLVHSGLHVATAGAYQALGRELTFTHSSSSINDFQLYVRALLNERSAGAASGLSANDFEAVVFRQHPLLKTIRGKLSRLGVAGARMTGSGSAIFAIYPSEEARSRAQRSLEEDRVFRQCRVIPASLVGRDKYRRLWRRQLQDHVTTNTNVWPPQSRYER